MTALPLVGQAISRVTFDHAVSFLSGDMVLRIETSFELHTSARPPATVDPEDAAAHATALVGWFGATIERAEVDEDGTLHLGVSEGRGIVVRPDDDYEAWTFAGAEGEHVVCLPGGGVTTWSKN